MKKAKSNPDKVPKSKPTLPGTKPKKTKALTWPITIPEIPFVKSNQTTSIDKLASLQLKLQNTAGDEVSPINLYYDYAAIQATLLAFTQWVVESKKVKSKGILADTKLLQQDPSHKYYAGIIANAPASRRLQTLYALASIIQFIPTEESKIAGSPLNVLLANYEELMTKGGKASKAVNPRISKDNRLIYARGCILSIRGKWLSAPYTPSSPVSLNNFFKEPVDIFHSKMEDIYPSFDPDLFNEQILELIKVTGIADDCISTSLKVTPQAKDNVYSFETLVQLKRVIFDLDVPGGYLSEKDILGE